MPTPKLYFVVSLEPETFRRIEYQLPDRKNSPRLRTVVHDWLETQEKKNPYMSRQATTKELAKAVEERTIA